MGIRLNIAGADTIVLDEHSIVSAKFHTDTPNDSNARATNVVNTMVIEGKILTPLGGAVADDTMKIAKWSLVRAEVDDSYREVTLEVVVASQVVRKVYFPHAFVVDYDEHYFDTEGVGTFLLTVRQRKDKFDLTTIEGGYAI